MDRVRRLTLGLVAFVLVGCACLWSPRASAWDGSISATQGAAMADCQAYVSYLATNNGQPGLTCVFISGLTPAGTTSCSSSLYSGKYQAKQPSGTLQGSGFFWCVPATCNAHDSGAPDQQWGGVYQNGIIYCNDGCMSAFHMNSGIGSLQFQNGDGGSWGHFVGNGNRCTSSIDASLLKAAAPAPPLCVHGGTSCYNPQRGFCATTEYGEQICEPAPPPGSGACAAGATGANCVGNNTPPPTPPDPPVQKGQPPDSSSSASATDSGGTTNNYTTNNYSGTSPGSGGGGSPASGSSSAGGSQSNTGGSGNSPGPGGSSGTNATTGKCADGSVPTASGCSGTATDNGCNTPPQCFGDAVLCGSYKEEVATRCAVQKMAAASASSTGANYGAPSSALAAAGVPADGGASSDPSTSGLVSSSDLGEGGFDSSGLGFSRTCPANPTFDVLGHSYEFDLSPFCNFASLLGWFVLLVACLVGLRIVATGKA